MPPPEVPHPTRRRLLWGLALALAAALLVWQALELALDVDRYRPQAEQELARLTGLPVTIGELDLALRPVPCLSALDVAIGKGDLHATTARLDFFPQLRALLARQVVISRIELAELSVTLPDSAERLERAWSDLREHLADAGGGAEPAPSTRPIQGFALQGVVAEQATLRFGEGALHPFVVTLRATGLADAAMQLALEAEVPSLGAEAEGTLEVPLSDAAANGLRGELRVDNLRTDRWFGLPAALHAAWDARVVLDQPSSGETRLALEGSVKPTEATALGGRYTVQARLAGDGSATLEATLDGDGVALRGSGRRLASGASTLRIDSLEARGAALVALLTAAASDPEAVGTTDDAALELRDLEFALPAEAPPVLVSGVLEVHGIEARYRGGCVADPLRVAARVADGAVTIEEVRGGAVALSGHLEPEPSWSQPALVLRGTIGISDALLRIAGAPESLHDAAGTVDLQQLRIVFGGSTQPGESTPLILRARLVGGAVRYASEPFSDRFSDVGITVTHRDGALLLDGAGRSAALGPLKLSGVIEPEKSLARGAVTFDAGTAAALVSDPATRGLVEPVLRAYGPGRLGLRVEWPDPGEVRLRLERAGTPSLAASVAFRDAALGDLEAEAAIPGEALRGLLPESARSSGLAEVRVRRSASDGVFSLDADLAPLGLAIGAFIEKQPGEPLRLALEGRAADAWAAEHIEITAAKGSLAGSLTGGGLAVPDLDLDLAAWSFLLVDGANASGRIRGSLDTGAPAAKLHLDGVALRLSPELAIESADGDIELTGADWSMRELRLQGARSDAVLDATLQNGHIRGRLAGARFDVDVVRALLKDIGELLPERDDPGPPAVRSGEFEVRLERVAFQRSEARNLEAELRWVEGDLQARELSFETYEGTLRGSLGVDAREDGPSQLALDLEIADVTGRFLDDMFAAEPRDVRGIFSGKLHFTAPLGENVKATLADGSGSLSAHATDGSFGKLGLATQLTTVLRSTEALRLKMPAFKDEGLVFDTVDAELTMQEGRAEITKFTLDSTSYAATARGYLDFRKNRSRVSIEFDAIRGITSILQRISVVGDVLKLVNVRLTATGSPYDLSVGIASVQDQLIGASIVGPNAVIGGARDVLNLLRAATAGARTEPPEAEKSAPADEPTPPATPAAGPEPPPAAAAPPEEAAAVAEEPAVLRENPIRDRRARSRVTRTVTTHPCRSACARKQGERFRLKGSISSGMGDDE